MVQGVHTTPPPIQWRSEGGRGGSYPRAPPEGGRQNPAKKLKKINKENLKNLKE